MISFLIAFPLIGILILILFKERKILAIISFIITFFEFLVSLSLFSKIDFQSHNFQFVESIQILEILPFYYKVGIDSLSFWMILLTTFLFPLVILGAYTSIEKNFRGYYISLMILESSIIGAFSALDLFLFYIFWELMLIPMFFIIGLWGGKDRIYATVKFVLFTMFGSFLMLIAIIYLGIEYRTFDYQVLLGKNFSFKEQSLLFWAFAISFLIKVPVVPVHTWLPDAHTEAPAGGSVILAGVLLKLGTYGLIRFNLPLFPEASIYYAYFISIIAVIGIIHGALTAAVQPDMKRLIAYSSVSHMGYIVLGIFSFTVSGLQGSIMQMINHALSTGALFFLVGMIYDQTHTRQISDYGGIAKVVPIFSVFFMIASLSSAGLPGLNGFIGEFTILSSAYFVYKELVFVAVFGVILGAWYILRLYGKVFYGELKNHFHHPLKDMNIIQISTLIPMVILMFYLGFYPRDFFRSIETSVKYHLDFINKHK
ncbi:MAG: NADH-quinone oxidoreductase subunit M [Candidatus Omnitrophica bacterium]|nr:NADH-quinone oxidoreductase subunit M [Candidatus Omnitrophota bacterium]